MKTYYKYLKLERIIVNNLTGIITTIFVSSGGILLVSTVSNDITTVYLISQ